MTAVLFTLKQYRKRISDKSIELLNLEEQPLYFSDPSISMSNEELNSVIDVEDMKDYKSGFTIDDEESLIGQSNYFFNN